MKNEPKLDHRKISELFISGKMSAEDIKAISGLTKTQIKNAVRKHANDAVNHMVSVAYESLDIADPFVFNRQPQERPTGWSSKYNPKSVAKKGTKIGNAVDIIESHYKKGTLVRDNRGRVIKEIKKSLKLKNDMTAATYFSDAKKLSGLDYTG
jgi:hypothetical protein